MKFKIHVGKEIRHNGVLSCVDWAKNDEVYTIRLISFILRQIFFDTKYVKITHFLSSTNFSDEQQLFKWNAKTRAASQVAKLPEDFYPTDLQWLCHSRALSKSPNTGSSSNSKTNDSLQISSSDGRFIILNRNARAERIVNAHLGPINAARWSLDGTSLLTAGEDGIIKVWSKLGMLRSTIIQNESPIRVACWSSNSMSIAYCTGPFIAIKPLAANSKVIKVKKLFV